ncbi:MAG: 2'-5' RNA ligase family protein [Methanomicrobiales archaeon]|nr:2'-5' RNA ligase family protein [Methanomicrobiales archaeon]
MTAGPARAIDIVLLPPGPVMEAAIALNRSMNEKAGNTILELDRTTAIPHISLAMGAVRAGDLPAIGALLDAIAAEMLPIEIFPDDIVTVTTSSGDAVSGLDLERTAALKELHERVMRAVEPFLLEEVTTAMVAAGEDQTITPFTAAYATRYREDAAYGRFSPHITLGYWKAGNAAVGFPCACMFRCTSIALCSLGNNCTCRGVISKHPASG